MSDVICVQQCNAILGEGPSWDSRAGVLYWVDIQRPAIYRFEPGVGQTAQWPMPAKIGCVVPTHDPHRLAFADTNGFGCLDQLTGRLNRLDARPVDLAGMRFNDGKVDRAGRFWAGTLNCQNSQPLGSLYRVDADHSVHRTASGFVISNGLGWSPDNRTLYFTDSITRTIWAYEFDLDTGELGERRDFARLSGHDGVFDGMTVDSEGFVWTAVWDGWRLIRYAPDGSIDREIPMPVQRPTSCMFGGSDLKTLYITSACDDLGCTDLQRGPLAGSLFALACDVPGIAEVPFAG